jgi:hypothetical protein
MKIKNFHKIITEVDKKNIDPRTEGNQDKTNIDPRTQGDQDNKNIDPRNQGDQDNKNIDPRNQGSQDKKNVDPRNQDGKNKKNVDPRNQEKEKENKKPVDQNKTEKKDSQNQKLDEPISYFKDYTPDKLNCTPWTIDNFFEENYIPEKRDVAAKRFVIWYVKKVDPKAGGFNIFDWHQPYYKQCGTDPGLQFLNNKDVHKNRVIQNLALTRTNYVKNTGDIDVSKDTLISAWASKDRKENPNDFLTPEQMKENRLVLNLRKKLMEQKKTKETKNIIFEKLSKIKKEKLIESIKLERKLLKISENLDNKKYKTFFNQLKETISDYKNTKSFLSEESTNSFSNSWNMIFADSEEQIKDMTIDKVLNSLKLTPESELYKEIRSSLESMPTLDMYMNPDSVSSKISLAIQNKIQNELVSSESEGIEGIVKMVIDNTIKSPENIDKIKYRVNQTILPVLTKAKENIESVSNEMKQSWIDKLGDNISQKLF